MEQLAFFGGFDLGESSRMDMMIWMEGDLIPLRMDGVRSLAPSPRAAGARVSVSFGWLIRLVEYGGFLWFQVENHP